MRRAVLLLVFLVLPVWSWAQGLSLRFTTAMYNWERYDTVNRSSKHLRLYQLADMSVTRLFHQRNLSFHLYGGISGDVGQRAGNDPQNLLYHAYLEWKNVFGMGRIKIGRQRIYSGVGFGTMDGISVRLRFAHSYSFLVYAGLLAPALNEARFESWKKAHMYGAQMLIQPMNTFRFSLSYVLRNRMPIEYLRGRFSQRVITFAGVQNHLVGVDAWYQPTRRLRFYGRLDYDLGLQDIRRAELTANGSFSTRLQLGIRAVHRTPYQNLNSIFSVFTQYGYDEYRLSVAYRFSPDMRFSGYGGVRSYKGDHSSFFGGGVYWKGHYAGYFRRSGYEGEGDNLVFQTQWRLSTKWVLNAGGNLFSYRIFPDIEAERETAVAGIFGLRGRLRDWLQLDAQIQYLKNERYQSDIRFFFRAVYTYFRRGQ
jgi:hypothetical protein